MRIELLATGSKVSNLQSGLGGLYDSITATITSLQSVNTKVNNISGGTQGLSGATSGLQARIRTEQSKQTALLGVGQKLDTFLGNTTTRDSLVAKQIATNQEAFYNQYSWLRPQPLKAGWEKFKSGWNKFWGDVGDVLKSAWQGVVKWYNDHPIISRIVIGVLAVAAGLLITMLTGGAALPFLIGAGIAIGASVLIGGVIGGVEKREDGSWGWNWQKAAQGAANGFMAGGIAAFAGAAIALTSLTGTAAMIATGTLSGGLLGGIDGGLSSGTLSGLISGLAIGAIVGGVTSAVFAGAGKLFSKVKTSIKASPKTNIQANDINQLKNIDLYDITPERNTLTHAFEGDRTGVYHTTALDNGAKIVQGTRTQPDSLGVFKAKVDIPEMAGEKWSTFWPDGTTLQQQVNFTNEAASNAMNMGGPKWDGYASNGIKVRMISKDPNATVLTKIKAFYPLMR